MRRRKALANSRKRKSPPPEEEVVSGGVEARQEEEEVQSGAVETRQEEVQTGVVEARQEDVQSGAVEARSLEEVESGAVETRPEEEVGNGGVPEPPARKRTRKTPKPEASPEFFPEKRNLEDLWQAAFPVGTEWENMDKLGEIKWDFSNLESAFEEGGALHGKTVYMFGCTEPQLLVVNGEQKVTLIPIVVVVDSPIPPSDKIGIKSVQRATEEIIPMKAMKMAWVPYIPLEDRLSQVDRLKTQIFTLGCTQRRSALKLLKIERVKQYDYCLPYFQPLKADEDEDDSVVNIMFPLEPPIVCDFDWELDEYEEFTDELIKNEALPHDKKDEFMAFVREQVKERKKAQREAKQARQNAIDAMDDKTKSAFENMKFYKFYPVQTPDTPDISNVKVPYINRYYGKAHFVM
ncbi:protein HEAT INTOLERANT 4 [Dioscorea cayenensis subsp. rotundata]|uniref:Protein HEAT INTOLERANT 4 n=1 Tax=Dioscorea cayennensis subsp. rotundata TaxID=55577 RepID=A0AB40AX65_DIOCR|nr:protein HEAT INTOLERANT 4 [Dioscorea cayenensis subsp. rotundata]